MAVESHLKFTYLYLLESKYYKSDSDLHKDLLFTHLIIILRVTFMASCILWPNIFATVGLQDWLPVDLSMAAAGKVTDAKNLVSHVGAKTLTYQESGPPPPGGWFLYVCGHMYMYVCNVSVCAFVYVFLCNGVCVCQCVHLCLMVCVPLCVMVCLCVSVLIFVYFFLQ